MSFGNKSDVQKHLSRKSPKHNLILVEKTPVDLVDLKLGETLPTPPVESIETPAEPK